MMIIKKGQILTKDFIRKGKVLSSQTIVLSIDGENREYGYLVAEDVYCLLDSKQELCLDHCFVEDFSLLVYKLLRNIPPHKKLCLENFSAAEAIFLQAEIIDFSYCHFMGENVADFSQTIFYGGDKSFFRCHFAAGVNFSGAKFCEGSVNFNQSIFEKTGALFSFAVFSAENVNFSECSFLGSSTSFVQTEFIDGDCFFARSLFRSKETDFSEAVFEKNQAVFNFSEFATELQFFACSFSGKRVSFCDCRFLGNGADFSETDFSPQINDFTRCVFDCGSLNFNNAALGTLLFTGAQFNNYADLRFNACSSLQLTDAVVRDIMDFIPSNKNKVKIDCFACAGIKIAGSLSIDWSLNQVKKMIDANDCSKALKAAQYRTLKENFRNIGFYEDEDKAYVEFKKYETRATFETQKKSKNWHKKIKAYFAYAYKYLIMEEAGYYGTSPLRVIVAMFWSILLFAAAYYFLFRELGINRSHVNFVENVGLNDFLNKVLIAFYHSMITFFTIGYGDVTPQGFLSTIVCGIEGFAGVFLMSYFTVAFVRKVLR